MLPGCRFDLCLFFICADFNYMCLGSTRNNVFGRNCYRPASVGHSRSHARSGRYQARCYTLLQPPYEANGNQVSAAPVLGDFFDQRALATQQGQTYAPPISFGLSGQANGKQPYRDWDYKDIAPRFVFAYSPHIASVLLHDLFGAAGKTSIRGDYAFTTITSAKAWSIPSTARERLG